jgi:hypothetical protein
VNDEEMAARCARNCRVRDDGAYVNEYEKRRFYNLFSFYLTHHIRSACSFGWWLVLICSERKVLLAGCWWLVCSERKMLVAGG